MPVSASQMIKAPVEEIWKAVTDIEGAAQRISCIKAIEILEKPESGLVGLKWKETREMFGKEAIETMWITEAEENKYYLTRAENCGCVYESIVKINQENGENILSMSFDSTPQTLMAKLMTPMMWMMKGPIRKAFEKDINEIKESLEK